MTCVASTKSKNPKKHLSSESSGGGFVVSQDTTKMRLARSRLDSAGLSFATNADKSKEPDRRLLRGLRDRDGEREGGGEWTGVAGAASFITRRVFFASVPLSVFAWRKSSNALGLVSAISSVRLYWQSA